MNEKIKAVELLTAALKQVDAAMDAIEAFAAKRFHAAGLKIGRSEMSYLIHETGYGNRESEYRLFNFDNDIKKSASSGISI